MPVEDRSWTEEEARAYLPRVRMLLGVIRRAAEVSATARANGHSQPREELVGDRATTADAREPSPDSGDGSDMSQSVVSSRQALEELSERGVILRDPSLGLVDFPSRRPSGLVVLLCWQFGEDDLAWWHLPEDGFAGRRPLPVPPEI